MHRALALLLFSAPGLASADAPLGQITAGAGGAAIHVGSVELGGGGLHLGVGLLDAGDVELGLEQSLMVLGSPSPGHEGPSLLSRTGVVATIPLGRWGDAGTELGGRLELGAGWQRIAGDRSVSRPDAAVGWILELRGDGLAASLGGRFLVAPVARPDDLVPLAAAPEQPEIDLGVMAIVGVRAGARRSRHSLAAAGDPDGATGFEYVMGTRDVGGVSYLAGGLAVVRTWSVGRLSVGSEGSLWALWLRDRERSEIRDDGVMGRVGALARLTVGRSELGPLGGEIFVDGGAGYAAGTLGSGRFREADVWAGVGAGYDLTGEPQALSTYVSARAIAAGADLDRLGGTVGFGCRWLR